MQAELRIDMIRVARPIVKANHALLLCPLAAGIAKPGHEGRVSTRQLVHSGLGLNVALACRRVGAEAGRPLPGADEEGDRDEGHDVR